MKHSEQEIIQEVKNATDLQCIFDAVSKLNFSPASSRLNSVINNQIKHVNALPNERIALFGNFTLDMLVPHIVSSTAMVRSVVDCYVGPYSQYYQSVLDDSSDLHAFSPDIIVLTLTIRELSPDLFYRFAELKHEQREPLAKEVIDHIVNWVNLSAKTLSANILVSNFIPPCRPQLGLADSREAETEIEFYQNLNKTLRVELSRVAQASLLDVASLALRIGWQQIYDSKFYYMAKLPWSDEFLQTVSQEIVKYMIAIRGKAKKCLVVDLDNTLWGGILGEEGVSGIKVGIGDPVGEAFNDFQHKVKSLKQRGVILALCSKNNYEDVKEAFAERKDMPLSMDDFAAARINWNMKHQNISEIAEELNIGLDSIVFVDDNPAEISLVQHTLPEVTSLQLPVSHEEIPEFLDNFPLFEKLGILESDRNKTQQYQDNRKRVEQKSVTVNLDDYLKSLETRVLFRRAISEDIQRVHQLFTKTNQFNLTTIRYSIDDIQRFIKDDTFDLYCFSVEDRFGNLGTVGVLLVEKKDDTADIISFVLSCRAMGRSVEVVVVHWVKNYYLNTRNFSEIRATYIPTKKNKPVEKLYLEQGFDTLSEDSNQIHYRLDTSSSELNDCNWIEFVAEI